MCAHLQLHLQTQSAAQDAGTFHWQYYSKSDTIAIDKLCWKIKTLEGSIDWLLIANCSEYLVDYDKHTSLSLGSLSTSDFELESESSSSEDSTGLLLFLQAAGIVSELS